MKSYKTYIAISVAGIFLFIVAFFANSFAVPDEEIAKVTKDQEETYKIQVSYDGIDARGVTSSNTTKANVKSDYIDVEDRLPDGLEFIGVSINDAVERKDNTTKCSGELVPKYQSNGWYDNGLKYYESGVVYDKTTRKINYTIKKLEAGCSLTVDIKTKVIAEDTNRIDFFHYAKGKENNVTLFSNVNHTYTGYSDSEQYRVLYQLEGDIPDSVVVPEAEFYTENQKVRIKDKFNINGYKFIGWTTDDVVVNNNEFIMPDTQVILKGKFQIDEVTPKYTVRYKIDGDTPEGYTPPTTKEYYDKEYVELDTLSYGDKVGNYQFLGWTIDEKHAGDYFQVNKNMTIHGKFEKVKYSVSYQFDDATLPENATDLLPLIEVHDVGEYVALPTIENVGNYEFKGWNVDKSFIMPAHDVIIVGRWQEKSLDYDINMQVETLSKKVYFKENDEINYAIKVTNTTAYPLEDIVVKESKGHTIIEGEGYEKSSPHIATINHLEPNESVTITAKYIIEKGETRNHTNEVTLVSAKTSVDRYRVKEKKVKARIAIASKLTICNEGSHVGLDRTFQYQISGVNTKYSSWVLIDNDGCKTIYLNPDEYQVKQIPLQEYTLKNITGAITTNNATFNVLEDKEYKITFQNAYRKKVYYHSSGKSISNLKGDNK